MARRDEKRPAVGAAWLHAGALSGFLLAGGGLLVGVWALFGPEQEIQRGMVSYLYSRAAKGRPAEHADIDAQVISQRYGDVVRIEWGWVYSGGVSFALGGYLAGISLAAMARRGSGSVSAGGAATGPLPAWLAAVEQGGVHLDVDKGAAPDAGRGQ